MMTRSFKQKSVNDATVGRIVDLMNRRGMTQKELADELGITNAAFSKWKSSTGKPYMVWAWTIKVLGGRVTARLPFFNFCANLYLARHLTSTTKYAHKRTQVRGLRYFYRTHGMLFYEHKAKGKQMITLYLIFKLTGWIIKISLRLLLLPFRLIFLPFRILFGGSRKSGGGNDNGFWDGLLIGSIFF